MRRVADWWIRLEVGGAVDLKGVKSLVSIAFSLFSTKKKVAASYMGCDASGFVRCMYRLLVSRYDRVLAH